MVNATISIFGAFNCKPDSDTQQQFIRVILNDQYVNKEGTPAPNSGGCYCPNCGSKVTIDVPSSILSANYFKGGRNTLQITTRESDIKENYLCLSHIIFTVKFTLPNSVIDYVTPLGGPSMNNTIITVAGTNFMDYPTHCLFRGPCGLEFTIKASSVSAQRITCDTLLPPVLLELESKNFTVGIRTRIGNTTVITDSDYTFFFYKQPQFTKVVPDSGPIGGSTEVQIYGSLPNYSAYASVSGTIKCMFVSHNEQHIVSGRISKSNAIACHTPPWKAKEKVRLRVSINGQYYTDDNDLVFKYVGNPILSTHVWIVLALIVGVSVVLVLAISGVWYRHHPAVDGYEMLNVGSVDLGIDEIEIGEKIGAGTFSEVYKGVWRGALVAVKRYISEDFSEETVIEFEQEVSTMKSLRAPNIVQYLGSAFNPPNICIITEYMSRGSLHDILHNKMAVFEWPLILRMLSDTARGMTYLHSCNPPIIHRDLKSPNLLVDEFWRVKVSDFGLSTVFDRNSHTMTACGTPYWTAPEVLRNQKYTVKVDVFSFAIIMWECVTRAEPYQNMPPFNVIEGVAHKGLRPKVPTWVPGQYKSLMIDCWQEIADLRPNFSTILDVINDELMSYNWSGQPGDINFGSSSNRVSIPLKMI